MKWLNDGERMRKLIAEQRAGRSAIRMPGGTGINALVLGGGGREYAIAWRLARCDSVTTIDVIPGNPAMSLFARTLDIPIDRDGRLEQHIAASFIDLVIVGPDELIASGVGATLRRTGVTVVCPSREAAKLEWSKSFAKDVLNEAGVPTASYRTFPDAPAARAGLVDGPVVVKADGLAAGKGVVVARDRAEADAALSRGAIAAGPVLLEEVLFGQEASLHALVDGETVVALPPARDHKRAGDGDTGPNTGGMGACSPTIVLPDDEAQPLADRLIAPVARLLVARGTPYQGVLYAGLMKTAAGWRVIEFNARFGDPEAQVILPRIGGDFARLMQALGDGRLAAYTHTHPVRFSQRAYVDVALCAEGYPGRPRVGDQITIGDLPDDVWTFHAGTRSSPSGGFVTGGGRVMHVVAQGDTPAHARERAYLAAERISWKGRFYRSDIAALEGPVKMVGSTA
ncbi:MAG TPA: phosphoribosylamine--glycine ligase [Candidatus Limnocylindria bacterium]|nr:phosphoribosylamine--glycine ligase [Candidatus Limnocylindria bacterium]